MNEIGVVERIKNAFSFRNEEEEWETINISNGKGWVNGNTSDLSEITYYTCMKILSESVAKLSIHLKNDDNMKVSSNDAIDLLKIRPNPYMSPSDFKSLMEFNRNHYGNAYALIEHDARGKFTGLHPLHPLQVKILIDNDKILKSKATYLYLYEFDGKKYYFQDQDILHLKGGISANGIVGKSIREELAGTLKGVKESQRYLNDLYASGLTAKAVVQYTGDLNQEKKKALSREIANFARDKSSGSIVPIPLGMDLKPLDIKLTDAQFFELKKFTALQIAAAFGVKPNHLNNYDKSSYANSEMQNLTYYIDTLLYILKKWEEELDYKLLTKREREQGLHFEFNVATILRGDLKTQADAITRYVAGSVYTLNEARDFVGKPSLGKEGDVLLVNGSYTDLENLGKAYDKGGVTDDRSKE